MCVWGGGGGGGQMYRFFSVRNPEIGEKNSNSFFVTKAVTVYNKMIGIQGFPSGEQNLIRRIIKGSAFFHNNSNIY